MPPCFKKWGFILSYINTGLGVCVTAQGSEFNFVSRGFFPKLKVNEDPVTGSLLSC
jgi:predicted PhzF superfamily epimerase YddE/YHI9